MRPSTSEILLRDLLFRVSSNSIPQCSLVTLGRYNGDAELMFITLDGIQVRKSRRCIVRDCCDLL